MFNRLLRLSEHTRSKYDISTLRFVAHGAAPVSPAIKRAMIEWWGPIIFEYYGSTETSILTFCSSEEWLAHPGTVGRPLLDTLMQIKNGAISARVGETGDIACKVESIATFGYVDDEFSSQVNGELFSPGDIGYFNSDGYLFLCDRSKDLVISGGVNIYPAEIEAELHRMPGISDCAVFGIPNEDFGEALCAAIQTQPGVHLSVDAIKDFLRNCLAPYKIPQQISFHDALPREDSGKIFKRKLREPYWIDAGRKI